MTINALQKTSGPCGPASVTNRRWNITSAPLRRPVRAAAGSAAASPS
jgi:hypothetical protein